METQRRQRGNKVKPAGPKKDFKRFEERTKHVIDAVPLEHQEKFIEALAEFEDVFRGKLPTGPPSKGCFALCVPLSGKRLGYFFGHTRFVKRQKAQPTR